MTFRIIGLTLTLQAQTRLIELYVNASYTATTASNSTEEFLFTTISDALIYRSNTLGNKGMISDEKNIVKAGTYSPTDTERIL